MARTVKPEEFASKRSQILDAAQRLVFTKGYEQMSLQDVLDEVQISSGAFHHYFNSRAALRDAFIARIKDESVKPLLPILNDAHLNAIQKLQAVFDALDQLRLALSAEIIKIARVWYTDDNALIRQRVDEAVNHQRAPLIGEIVRQGVNEGLFNASRPEKTGEVIQSLLQAMGDTLARAMLSEEFEHGNPDCIADIVATHAAYLEAVERLLGAAPNSLRRTDAAAVKVWWTALQTVAAPPTRKDAGIKEST
jgi:AcrR family transcriptional regulator